VGQIAPDDLTEGRRQKAPLTGRRSLVAMLGVAFVIATPAAGTPTWGAPVQISTGDRALGPELATNAAGDGLVVWDQEVGAECPTRPAALSCTHIVTAAARFHGSTAWATPVEISRPGVGARPRVAVDPAGNAAIVWVHDIGRDRVLQATYRHGPAGAWPEPSDLSEPVLQIRNHRIALDAAGNAIAVWAERSADTFVVRGEIRSGQSGVWGAPVTLSTPGTNVSAGPSLALVAQGLGAVAWVEGGIVRASLIHLARWQPVVTVSRPTTAVEGAPSVAVGAEGDTVVVWPARRGPDEVVEAAFLAYRPGTWSAPVEIGVRRPTFETPEAAVDLTGNADVAWVGPRGVETASRSYASGAWSRPVRVSMPPVAPFDVGLSIHGPGNAVALWRTVDGRVQAALRPRAFGTWQPPIDVSSGGSAAPSVALDAYGRAVAVWNRISGERITVESTDLDGRGPVLDRLVAPRAVALGARARFSIRAAPWAVPLAGVAHWTFGDGDAARGTEVSHVFDRIGRYTVTFTHADARGDISTATNVVRVVARVRNVRRPSIVGVPNVRATLTCRPGAWTGSPPITFVYSWQRDRKLIARATSRRYRLVRRDAGSLIACRVTATNPAGSVRAVSAAVAVTR